MVQGCVYASSVDVPLEVIAAAGKRQVVEVGGPQPLSPSWGLFGLRWTSAPSDQIALSFNSFRGYLVSRHSIPPLTIVVDADLSMA